VLESESTHSSPLPTAQIEDQTLKTFLKMGACTSLSNGRKQRSVKVLPCSTNDVQDENAPTLKLPKADIIKMMMKSEECKEAFLQYMNDRGKYLYIFYFHELEDIKRAIIVRQSSKTTQTTNLSRENSATQVLETAAASPQLDDKVQKYYKNRVAKLSIDLDHRIGEKHQLSENATRLKENLLYCFSFLTFSSVMSLGSKNNHNNHDNNCESYQQLWFHRINLCQESLLSYIFEDFEEFLQSKAFEQIESCCKPSLQPLSAPTASSSDKIHHVTSKIRFHQEEPVVGGKQISIIEEEAF